MTRQSRRAQTRATAKRSGVSNEILRSAQDDTACQIASPAARNDRQSYGRFYGVGLGPGDPELITVAAKRVLEEVDCIFYPGSQGSEKSVSKQILQSLNIPQQKVHGIALCMGADRSQALEAYRKAAQDIAQRVQKKGQSIAFITEGDPLFYSTFIYIYEALRLHHPTVPVQIISGISSVFHAASRAGLPVARQEEKVAILSCLSSEDELERLMTDFDTVFLLKLPRTFDVAYRYLARRGLLHCAVYLEKLGTPQERVERDLSNVNSQTLPYFSLLMIRKSLAPSCLMGAGKGGGENSVL